MVTAAALVGLPGPATAFDRVDPITTVTTQPTTTIAPATTTTSGAPPPATTTTIAPADQDAPTSTTSTSTTVPAPGAAPSDLIDVTEVPPEQRDLLERYLSIERESADLITKLDMVDGGLASARRDLDDAARKVAAADRTLARTEQRLTSIDAQLEAHRARLRVRAVQAYIGGSQGAGSDRVILQAASMDDLGKTLAYGAAVIEDEHTLVEATAELHRQADELHAQSEQDARDADAARALVAQRQNDLQSEYDGIVGSQSKLAQNAQAKLDLLSEAARLRVDIEAGYARKQAVTDSISNVLGKRQTDQNPPDDIRGIFLSPIPHPKINQPFGSGYDPLLGVTRGHPGIDINGRTGDPIRAPADGDVVAAGWVDGYGNCTIIDHGNALGTLYGHQSVLIVKAGDHVRRGQVIGLVGSTGYSTGPHLHWEVRVHGNVVNPAPFVGDQN